MNREMTKRAKRAEMDLRIAEMEAEIARLKEEADRLRFEETRPIGPKDTFLEDKISLLMKLVEAGVDPAIIGEIAIGVPLSKGLQWKYCPFCGRPLP